LCPILLPSQTAHHSVWIEIGRFGDEPRSMNFTLSITFSFLFLKHDFNFLQLKVTIDGADESDTMLTLIKGGGGCLTQVILH
jgi:hypothetical protein